MTYHITPLPLKELLSGLLYNIFQLQSFMLATCPATAIYLGMFVNNTLNKVKILNNILHRFHLFVTSSPLEQNYEYHVTQFHSYFLSLGPNCEYYIGQVPT
jgi:hypothetical protein